MSAPRIAAGVLALAAFAGGAPSPAAPVAKFDLQTAIELAAPGATIVVPPGVYDGPVRIDRPLSLRGTPGAVVVGNDTGSVIEVSAPNVAIRGLTIRRTGTSLEKSDAGIAVVAADVLVEDNVLEEVLFGIVLDGAPRALVRRNTIHGLALPLGRRGDAIRVWESDGVRIEDNVVVGARDVVVWYSTDVTVAGNRVEHGRYGLHFMYADRAHVERNRLQDNSVGVYLMYSRDMRLADNTVARNRGPSGFGLGLKDVDRLSVVGNRFLGNRVGMYVDNSPADARVHHSFERNVIAYNDVGIEFLPAVKRNAFADNTFFENLEQVSVLGAGTFEGNDFTPSGRGNFWSDYTGYDLDGDGFGDVPYRAQSLFENLLDRQKNLRLFLFSPAQQTIELAARALPVFRPRPKLEDSAPRMQAISASVAAEPLARSRWPFACLAAVLCLGSVFALRLSTSDGASSRDAARAVSPRSASGAPLSDAGAVLPSASEQTSIRFVGVHKHFGRFVALDDFTVDVPAGEAVALWGRNGAGKTTAIRCLLGLHRFRGDVFVHGRDARRAGKSARRLLGYVPQELAFHDDLRAEETLRFYAELKGVSSERIRPVLEEVGMSAHAAKRIRELSGGMKQRIALAAALLADPPTLVLDEMTAHLDQAGRDGFLRLLAALKSRGKTILFTSHRLDEVMSLADRVVVLDRGRMRAECAARDLPVVLGTATKLRLRVGRERVESAAAALRAHGFDPSFNGGPDVTVRVALDRKMAPLHVLVRAGIDVEDFDVATDGELLENLARTGMEES